MTTRRACRLTDAPFDVIYHPDSQQIESISNFNNPNDYKNLPIYKARLCDCRFRTSYCLVLNNENYCSSTAIGSDATTHCYYRSPLFSMVQMFWGPLYFSLLILFLAMFTTACGQHARNYMLSKCFPCLNRRLINRILTREARAREEMRRVLREAQSRPDGMREQMSLQLKTKTLCYEDDHNDDDAFASQQHDANHVVVDEYTDHDQQYHNKTSNEMCSICMVPLENGERVGDLDCGHHFHVECLKTWVLWRNVCPLCNAKNIAKTKLTLVASERV